MEERTFPLVLYYRKSLFVYQPAYTAEVINANYIMFELPSDIANICALNDYVRRLYNEIKHNLSPNGDVLIIKLFYGRSRCVRAPMCMYMV